MANALSGRLSFQAVHEAACEAAVPSILPTTTERGKMSLSTALALRGFTAWWHLSCPSACQSHVISLLKQSKRLLWEIVKAAVGWAACLPVRSTPCIVCPGLDLTTSVHVVIKRCTHNPLGLGLEVDAQFLAVSQSARHPGTYSLQCVYNSPVASN